MKMMIPSRLRRVRVLATFIIGAVMLYAWSKNVGPTDPIKYRKGLVSSVGVGQSVGVGGGAVLRNGVQEAPLQPPSVQQPPPPPPPPSPPPPPPSPPENLDRAQAAPGQANPTPTTTTRRIAGNPLDEAGKPTPPPSVPDTDHYSPDDDIEEENDDDNDDEPEAAATSSSILVATSTKSVPHWIKLPEHYPISTTMQLPTGTSKPIPQIQRATEKLAMHGADSEKRAAVKAATLHSWNGYRKFAFGKDEVKPVTGGSHEAFNNWGATLVDALDTLWVMGFKDEFEEAVEQVGKIDFTTSNRYDIPLFETVIRYLGGLVAAYDVSGKAYRTLLDKAVELAEVLYGAFDTPNRAPITYYHWRPESAASPRRASNRIVLAELGTLSMEFTRLAQLTGEPKYYDAVARLTDMLEEWQYNTSMPGMWPLNVDGSGCGPLPPESLESSTSKPKPSQQQLPNTNAIPPGVAVDSGELLTGFGQPGDLDEHDTKHHADQPVNPESHGNIYRRQLEEDWDAIDDELEMLGDVEETDNTTDSLAELDQRGPATSDRTVQPVVNRQERCAPQGLVAPPGSNAEQYTLAGGTDSMFEYLPKEYMLLGGQVEKYKTMYLGSMKVAIDKLLYKPMTEDERDILMSGYVTLKPDYSKPAHQRGTIEEFTSEIAHLACFAGGMFAMGGVIFDQPDHVEIGRKITEGCVWAYNVSQTGVMPEGAIVMKCENTWGECKWNESAWYDELDPYSKRPSNVNVQKPVPVLQRESKPQLFEANRAYYHPKSSGQDTGPVARGPRDGTLNRRQLEEADLDEAADTEPAASSSTTASASSTSSSAAAASSISADINPPTFEVTPTLSHEDYARKKIADQRLPPGFTRFNSRKYILRPEAIESVFYMYRITGDPHWREVGWDMFTAVEKYTKAPYGYSAINDMTNDKQEPSNLLDSMESFWLAETLKYFYLLFDDPAKWSLDEWVLNTEAHLFKRPPYKFAQAS